MFGILLGKTREEIVEMLGEPDDVSVPSRKYKIPLIYVYGNIEYHFNSEKGVCVLIFDNSTHKTLERL